MLNLNQLAAALQHSYHRVAAFFVVFAGFFMILLASNKMHQFTDGGSDGIASADVPAPSSGDSSAGSGDSGCGDGCGGK